MRYGTTALRHYTTAYVSYVYSLRLISYTMSFDPEQIEHDARNILKPIFAKACRRCQVATTLPIHPTDLQRLRWFAAQSHCPHCGEKFSGVMYMSRVWSVLDKSDDELLQVLGAEGTAGANWDAAGWRKAASAEKRKPVVCAKLTEEDYSFLSEKMNIKW